MAGGGVIASANSKACPENLTFNIDLIFGYDIGISDIFGSESSYFRLTEFEFMLRMVKVSWPKTLKKWFSVKNKAEDFHADDFSYGVNGGGLLIATAKHTHHVFARTHLHATNLLQHLWRKDLTHVLDQILMQLPLILVP
ncbi:hypothetical protein L6452_15853 [Arctium lappa]|uniref:Uncharacterized protein n=1 Tax=Arctium lappa TaxID=4217 RepID=A0ACB9CPT9_ARCLA|nr:hypothetical protein L6452_15853 [Arctium lappa]